MWRYRSWLPVGAADEPVSLGEGATPLLEAARLEPGAAVLLKLESTNPTLAFKDRPVSVAATAARANGQAGLLCASTGNTAVSVAAYAARAGLPAVCVVPRGTPAAKVALATQAGARLLEVAGSFSDALALASVLAERAGWANLTTTYVNPYMLEGDKTLGLELFEQLGDGGAESVIVPVGAGPLLAGVGKAFDELVASGRAVHRPRLFGVQAAGCAPIARAFAAGEPVRAWSEAPATAAGAIADPLVGYPEDGDRTLAAIRSTGGAALAVSDDEIETAAADLAAREGVTVEPAAAAALAGYRALRADGRIGAHERTVLVLTGHASKAPPAGDARPSLGVVDPGDVDRAQSLLGPRRGPKARDDG